VLYRSNAGHPHLVPDGRSIAVLYGNFALCGNRQEPAICCLSGFIAEADDWDSFDCGWRALLAKISSDLDATACLHGTGIFQSWHVSRRQELLRDLSDVLVRSGLAPAGTFVYRDHFSELSLTQRTILLAEGITTPLDVILYDFTEQLIRKAHHESEKISLVLEQGPHPTTQNVSALFNKHLSRYLLGPHLVTAPDLSNVINSSCLRAARLLEEIIFLAEAHKSSSEIISTSASVVPPALQRMAESISERSRFDTAGLEKMAAKLKRTSLKIQRDQERSGS
jgi:hypothetical protein